MEGALLHASTCRAAALSILTPHTLTLDQALPAVRAGNVAVADGNRYFNRSSCGVLETAEMVAEIAHSPLRGMWGHHGHRWVRLPELASFCERDGAAAPTKRVEVAPAAAADETPHAKKPRTAVAHEASSAVDPTEHVREQVRRLRAGDYEGAFALNSSANQARLGGAVQFETILTLILTLALTLTRRGSAAPRSSRRSSDPARASPPSPTPPTRVSTATKGARRALPPSR